MKGKRNEKEREKKVNHEEEEEIARSYVVPIIPTLLLKRP